jgi:hypothetical protein
MTKQTKQLLALGVLVLVGGVIGAWNLGLFGGDETPAPAATDPNAAAATPTPTTPPATPAGGPSAPTTPGAPAPTVQETDLEIPDEVNISMPRYNWNWDNGGQKFEDDPANKGALIAYDPLWVQNIDVVDPKRKEYIDKLKQEWVLDGLIETVQRVTREDENGNKVEVVVPVLEAWFKSKNRPYGEKDRLTNTRFTIDKIFKDRVYRLENGTDFKVRSGVDLAGDTGAKLTIFVGDDRRYEEK